MAAAVSTAASGSRSTECLGLMSRLLRWPAAQLFPVLDVARCLVVHPAAAAHLAAAAGAMSAPTVGSLSGALAAAVVSGTGPALQTSLRLLANCFKEQVLRDWVLQNRELLLDGFAGCYSAGSAGATKAVRLSLATLLLNYAVAAVEQPSSGSNSDEAAMQLLSGLEQLLGALPAEEGDAAVRAVLALGNLLIAGGSDMVNLANELGLDGQVSRFGAATASLGSNAAQLGGVVQEVQQLLR